jgi:hypothetical protein
MTATPVVAQAHKLSLPPRQDFRHYTRLFGGGNLPMNQGMHLPGDNSPTDIRDANDNQGSPPLKKRNPTPPTCIDGVGWGIR